MGASWCLSLAVSCVRCDMQSLTMCILYAVGLMDADADHQQSVHMWSYHVLCSLQHILCTLFTGGPVLNYSLVCVERYRCNCACCDVVVNLQAGVPAVQALPVWASCLVPVNCYFVHLIFGSQAAKVHSVLAACRDDDSLRLYAHADDMHDQSVQTFQIPGLLQHSMLCCAAGAAVALLCMACCTSKWHDAACSLGV